MGEKGREEAAQHVMVLELELTSRGKVSDYERQRKEAQEAILAAQTALEEAKKKEKESAVAAKHALKEQREKEVAFLNEKSENAAEGMPSKKEAIAAQKGAEKASVKEMKE